MNEIPGAGMQIPEIEQPFTQQQVIAISLIQADLRFLFTVIKNSVRFESNYIVSLMPYMGVIIDGTEDWLQAYNRSSKQKLMFPTFDNQEQLFFEEMRSTIKMWNTQYNELYQRLKSLYEESDRHFSTLCCPIAKALHLYDVFGADLVNGQYCGNTILCAFYSPKFRFDISQSRYGENIRKMMEIGGKYISIFGSTKAYPTYSSMLFKCADYGGFVKSPVGNKFSDKFVLFSLLCQIQFVLVCIDEFITEECTTKLRFLYLQYYYSVSAVKEYNRKTGAGIRIDSGWVSDKFRNTMAHYKIGIALKTDEIVWGDPLFGLTQKFLNTDYFTLKNTIKATLKSTSRQIRKYLNLN